MNDQINFMATSEATMPDNGNLANIFINKDDGVLVYVANIEGEKTIIDASTGIPYRDGGGVEGGGEMGTGPDWPGSGGLPGEGGRPDVPKQ